MASEMMTEMEMSCPRARAQASFSLGLRSRDRASVSLWANRAVWDWLALMIPAVCRGCASPAGPRHRLTGGPSSRGTRESPVIGVRRFRRFGGSEICRDRRIKGCACALARSTTAAEPKQRNKSTDLPAAVTKGK